MVKPSSLLSRLEFRLGLCLLAGLACLVVAGVFLFQGRATLFLTFWGLGLLVWICTEIVWQTKTGVSLYVLEEKGMDDEIVETRLLEKAMEKEILDSDAPGPRAKGRL